ncbi:MAG: S24 family peptidase [Burkholderia gladioli]
MKTIDEIRLGNLSLAIERLGSARKLAEAARVSDAYLSQIKNRLTSTSSGKPKVMGDEVARKIEVALNEPVGWMDTDRTIQAKLTDPKWSGEVREVVVWNHPDDLPPDPDRVWIDRYDFRLSAGDGKIQWEIQQKQALPFDGDFFKRLGSRAKNCKLVKVSGESMEPYLFHDDTVLIDVTKTEIFDGRIYALVFEDEQFVKQVFKEPGGGLTLHSLNPRYRDKAISPDSDANLHIAGRVIYRSGMGGFV